MDTVLVLPGLSCRQDLDRIVPKSDMNVIDSIMLNQLAPEELDVLIIYNNELSHSLTKT